MLDESNHLKSSNSAMSRVKIILGLTLFLGLVGCSDSSEQSNSKKQHGSSNQSSSNQIIKDHKTGSEQSVQSIDQLRQQYAQTPMKVLSVAEMEYQQSPAIAVNFSVPIDPKLSLSQWLNVIDNQGRNITGSWILSSSLNTAYFPFIKPETDYQVLVSNGLPAINGETIEHTFKQKLKTSARPAQLRFVSQGSLFSPKLSEGLAIEATNVDAVDIDFHQVLPHKLGEFINDYLGNNYYELSNAKRYIELVYSARYELEHSPNTRTQHVIPLTSIERLKQPGIYIAVMKQAGDYPYDYQINWFTVGDIALQVRQWPKQQWAMVNYVDNGQPVDDVLIKLYDQQGRLLTSEKSDKNGQVLFTGHYKTAALATAEKDQHYSLVKLKTPAMDLSGFNLPSTSYKPLELFLYGPRNVYRANEQIIINGLLRDHNGHSVPKQPINYKLINPQGRVHASGTWESDEQGLYQFNHQLSNSVPRGNWRFQAELGNRDQFDYEFKIEDFLPERIRVELTPNREIINNNESLNVEVQADYLYGAPAANARVEADVSIKPLKSLSTTWKDYVFGQAIVDFYPTNFSQKSLETDEKGHLDLAIENRWRGVDIPLTVTSQISVYETGGRPVTRKVQQQVWPSDQLIGIKPNWKGSVASPNENVSLSLIAINPDQALQSVENLELLLIREDQGYYWQWDDGWRSQSLDREQPVWQQNINLSSATSTQINPYVDHGNYRLEVRKQGNSKLLASYRFFAGWHWNRNAGDMTSAPDKVELNWLSELSTKHKNAKLKIAAPYLGNAIITVESDELLWQQTVELKHEQQEIEVPLNKDWDRQDIFATVTVIRPGQAQYKHLPKRAFGMIQLPLKRNEQQLELSFKHPEKALPETELELTLSALNLTADDTYFTVAMVDSGVLSVTNFKTPDPYSYWFSPRAYQGEIRDNWGNLIEQITDRRAKHKFGGDSLEEELARGGDAPASDVQIVSWMSNPIKLNQQGESKVSIPLPYFNGEVRLMVMAYNKTQLGSIDARVKVAAPLVSQISYPRFLANQDESMATLDLQNMSDSVQQLKVTLTANDSLGKQSTHQSVQLKPQQKSTLSLPITATKNNGSGKISLTIEGLEQPIARQWKVGLRPAFPIQNDLSYKVVANGEAFSFNEQAANHLQKDGQAWQFKISDKPPFDTERYAEQLLQYPYGCLEQTTSRAWPWLTANGPQLDKFVNKAASISFYSDLTDVNNLNDPSQVKLKAVNQAIARISGLQRRDGSFGLWSPNSAENHWLTAYATDFLWHASEQGFSVDQNALQNAQKRLIDYVVSDGYRWSEGQHYSTWPEHYHFSYRAFSALVLAKRQLVRLGDLRSLYENKSKHAKTRLPIAMMALAFELSGDKTNAMKAWQKAFAKFSIDQGYAGDYGSPVRDNALTMVLASQSKLVDQPFVLIFELSDQLIARRWLSTQEQYALWQLGQSLEQQPVIDQKLEVVIDQVKQLVTLPTRFTWRQSATQKNAQLPRSFEWTNSMDKPIYVASMIQGYPTKTPKPVSEGIKIQRSFYNLQGQKASPQKLKGGEQLIVRLDVAAQKETNIPEALVIDLLPAGWELENQNLEHAFDINSIVIGGKQIEEWHQASNIKHQEFRDDRMVVALPLYRQYASVFYLVRAVTPGKYILPPSIAEDMYRPYLRAIGDDSQTVNVLQP